MPSHDYSTCASMSRRHYRPRMRFWILCTLALIHLSLCMHILLAITEGFIVPHSFPNIGYGASLGVGVAVFVLIWQILCLCADCDTHGSCPCGATDDDTV